jgi:hypothetical protein
LPELAFSIANIRFIIEADSDTPAKAGRFQRWRRCERGKDGSHLHRRFASACVPGSTHGANRVSRPTEHFVAYAGSAAIAMAGYGVSRGGFQIIGGFWAYAGLLEYLQHFSPGRHPSIADFAASALGALCGGLASALLWRRTAM